MKLIETNLPDLLIIEPQKHADARGFFARSFCEETLASAGVAFHTVQCNISRNLQVGTLRGMHYQVSPCEEPKIVRCTAGKIFDVAVDLRPASSTYCQWFGLELTSDNHLALLIPAGFAHGFMTLAPHVEVFYQMGGVYSPAHSRGARWNDPAFGIEWPFEPHIISEKDAIWPEFLR